MIAPSTIVGGRYRVVRSLGGGGMKLVYLAEDLRLAARPCALAEMVDSFTNPEMQQQAVAAFQREADMLAQLSNEHIPRIFDRFSEANRHYLVMEYIEGVTLEDALNSAGGKLERARVVDVAIQVLDTLDYLHNLMPPVIYRDLKPSNVMLTRDGQAKLIDFGIARHFQPLSNVTMIGTQGYAPPEQYRGKVETRSDLYALGATMHHAISGRDPSVEPPFSFPPLRNLCPDVNPALGALVDSALAYDVVNRVRDAAEFKRRLVAIKTGAPDAIASASVPLSVQPTPAASVQPAAAAGKPQLKLPLGRPASLPASPSLSSPAAPTILTAAGEITCPGCRRLIPADSRFCSYCAINLASRGANGADSNPNADTVVLSNIGADAIPPRSQRQPTAGYRIEHRRTSQRRPHRRLWILIAIFAGAFMITKLIYERASATTPDIPPAVESTPPGAAPDASDDSMTPGEAPDLSVRLLALRRALDAAGYGAVHFRMDGNLIMLWGEIPSEFDRAEVQGLVFTVAGIFEIEDNLKVNDVAAAP